MSNLQPRQRRKLRFDRTEDIYADIERLKSAGHETTGDWTLAQIVMHLALAAEQVYVGLDFQLPWMVRTFIGPLFKRKFLRGSMLAGYKIPNPNSKILPPADADIEDAFARLQSAYQRNEREAPQYPHPFIGKLTHAEWKLLALRHAELHLSFAHPVER